MSGTAKDIHERDASKQFLIGGSGVSDFRWGSPNLFLGILGNAERVVRGERGVFIIQPENFFPDKSTLTAA